MPQRPMPKPPQRQAPMPPSRAAAARPVLTVTAPPVVPAVAQREAMPVAAARPAQGAVRLAELVRSKNALRQGILLAEVLGKPKALQDEI
jgi:hypothetical protein